MGSRLSLTSTPRYIAALVCISGALSSAVVLAQDAFSKGARRISLIAGAGNSFDDDYLILGVGAGYYVIDGLELGLNWQTWLGGDPEFNQLTPELTYVFRHESIVDPYVGVLYRRLFIDGLDDLSGYGGRLGVNIATGSRSYLGVGAIYVNYSSCDEDIYLDCSESYPEITFNLLF